MIEFTDWAVEVVARASQAAARLNPDARLRLAANGELLEATLTDAPAAGDRVVEVGGDTVFVAEGLEGLIDVGAHDRLMLRPAGSEPNPRSDP